MFDEDQRSYRSCEVGCKAFTSVDQALIEATLFIFIYSGERFFFYKNVYFRSFVSTVNLDYNYVIKR